MEDMGLWSPLQREKGEIKNSSSQQRVRRWGKGPVVEDCSLLTPRQSTPLHSQPSDPFWGLWGWMSESHCTVTSDNSHHLSLHCLLLLRYNRHTRFISGYNIMMYVLQNDHLIQLRSSPHVTTSFFFLK